MPYRPQGEFTGLGASKRLSAHSIASFTFLQGAANFDDLTIEAPMMASNLRRLLRRSAVDYWTNSQSGRPGERAWLTIDGSSMRLTPAGLNKVFKRAHGEDRTSNGRRSPYNVSLHDIRLALDLIANGSRSALGGGIPLEFFDN